MDWVTINPALIAIVADLTGLQTVWQNREQPFIDDAKQAICLLQIFGVRELGGKDDLRISQDLTPRNFTADFTTQFFTSTGTLNLSNGDIVDPSTDDTLPNGLTTGPKYLVNVDGNDFQLSLTSGGSPIAFTDNGTGTQTITPGKLILERTGPRQFTLTVRCDSYRQDDLYMARNTLEKLRTRMDWPRVNDALDAVNCAFVDSKASVDLDAPKDSRVISMASIDFIMTTTDSEIDSENPIGYIGSVDITSHLTVGGNELPEPPNYEETLP
jgi:hypothetical protein